MDVQNQKESIARVKAVDGLRGLAALMVVLNHLIVVFLPAVYWGSEGSTVELFLGETPLNFFLNGDSGGGIFLAITGYGTYKVMQKNADRITKFVLLRYIKLLILTIVGAISVIIVEKARINYYGEVKILTGTIWLGDFSPAIDNFLVMLKYKPLYNLTVYNPTLWTMKYIFSGSMMSVILSALINKKRHNKVAVAGIMAICFFTILNFNEICYMACFMGTCLAFMEDEIHIRIKWYWELVLGLVAIYLCGYPTGKIPMFCFYKYLPSNKYGFYHLIGVCILLLITLKGKYMKTIMKTWIAQFLGNNAMGIYAIHFSIIISFSSYMYLLNILKNYHIVTKVILVFLLSILVICLCGYCVSRLIKKGYYLIEKVYSKLIIETDEKKGYIE